MAVDGLAGPLPEHAHLVPVHQLEHLKQVIAVVQVCEVGALPIDEVQHCSEGPRGGAVNYHLCLFAEVVQKLHLKFFVDMSVQFPTQYRVT